MNNFKEKNQDKNYTEFTFLTEDGAKIYYYRWISKKSFVSISQNSLKSLNPVVVHIVHGMGEHARRYDNFATFLNENEISVYAMDQRGHGLTALNPSKFGHQDDVDGWFKVIGDLKKMNDLILKENPNCKLILFGHSAGSFLVRDFLISFPEEAVKKINGVILSGTAASPGFMGKIGIILANYLIKKYGPKVKSPLHRNLTFGKFNSYFKPNRTTADWISRDENVVDEMLKDPFCYTLFSATFYKDLIESTLRINNFKNISKMPKNIPILLISGTKCAVGNFTKGVKKVYGNFIAAGLKNTELKLYDQARHELINELNYKEVFTNIKEWIFKICLNT